MNKKRTISTAIAVIVFTLSGLAPYAWGAQKYALLYCQTYNGPGKEGGEFFFNPTAQKSLTLNMNEPYSVLKEDGNWLQVDVFGKTPWVEKDCMAVRLPDATLRNIHKERLESFNKVQGTNNRKHIHAGARQEGNKLVFLVSDRWHGLSSDMKEAYVRESMMLFMGMGGARQISEKADDYTLEIRHSRSDRMVAKWDSLWGFKLTDKR